MGTKVISGVQFTSIRLTNCILSTWILLLHLCMTIVTVENRPDEGPTNAHTTPREAPGTGTGTGTGRTPPCLTLLKYMVPSVLVLAGLSYQGKLKSVFEGNPAPAWCLLVAIIVYSVTVALMKEMPPSLAQGICHEILWHAALAFGVLFTVSLFSIFLPRQVSFVPLVIWTLLPILLAWSVLCDAYNWLHRGIKSVVDKIHAKVVNWIRGCRSSEQAPLPV